MQGQFVSTATSAHSFRRENLRMSDGNPKPVEVPLEIRLATIDDWMTVAEFNSRLASETEDKLLDPETIAAGVRALLMNSRHGRYFVACLDGKIVGQMMHTREWSDWRNGEIWWIQSVYVLSDYRKQGVFRALFNHLTDLAQTEPGVIGLRLYVEEHNSRAQQVYSKLNMRNAGYIVLEKIFRNDV